MSEIINYIGEKIYKPMEVAAVETREDTIITPAVNKWPEYEKIANWCNDTGTAYIEDCGEYYECKKIPDPTFDELKQAKLSTLENSFNTRVSGSFTTTQGYKMQFNRSDCVAVQGAVELLKISQSTGYLTDADNITHEGITLETMQAVLIEMLTAYATCHKQKQAYRAAINNAADINELNNIEFNWQV